MNLSRKDFLRRGFTSLGTLLRNPDTLLAGETARSDAPADVAQQVPVVDNGRCLAQRGGCFTCLESCPHEALGIRLGVGIEVAGDRCDGCRACMDACPLAPKAIRMQPVESV